MIWETDVKKENKNKNKNIYIYIYIYIYLQVLIPVSSDLMMMMMVVIIIITANTYSVPGTVLSILHGLTNNNNYNNSYKKLMRWVLVIPILQRRKLRLREVE